MWFSFDLSMRIGWSSPRRTNLYRLPPPQQNAAFAICPAPRPGRYRPPRRARKLNLAMIGAGVTGLFRFECGDYSTDYRTSWHHNIAPSAMSTGSIFDKASERYPSARKYNDFRKMIDWEANNIDAVTVCSTDHTHAPASMAALRAGKHVYCEKPLTHSIYEARRWPRRPERPGWPPRWATKHTPAPTTAASSN